MQVIPFLLVGITELKGFSSLSIIGHTVAVLPWVILSLQDVTINIRLQELHPRLSWPYTLDVLYIKDQKQSNVYGNINDCPSPMSTTSQMGL